MTPAAEDSKDTPSKFGKKFRMNMSFGMKKLAKTQTNEKDKPVIVEEKEDTESDAQSSKTSNSRVVDENFLGSIQKIRFAYEDEIQQQLQRQSAQEAAGGALGESRALELHSSITPSLPSETPVLKPPLNTTILIQEDRPEAGGVADLFEGKVGGLGENADLIEKVAPMWLADVLLKNQLPIKDIVKISFVLEPWKDSLPSIAADGYVFSSSFLPFHPFPLSRCPYPATHLVWTATDIASQQQPLECQPHAAHAQNPRLRRRARRAHVIVSLVNFVGRARPSTGGLPRALVQQPEDSA